MRIAVVVVCGTQRQNECFWPTYHKAKPGVDHDLIVIHRDNQFLLQENLRNDYGKIELVNKIKDGIEVEHKAFGAYRFAFHHLKEDYDTIAFISDDVLIKRDDWLKKATDMLWSEYHVGFVSTMMFNTKFGKYPHPSHIKAPCWFAKTYALRELDWKFDYDHDGEMRIAEQFVQKGFYGLQVGSKFNVAYDALENGGIHVGDHVTSLLEMSYNFDLKTIYSSDQADYIDKMFLEGVSENRTIRSPYAHIGVMNVLRDLQPFNGLVYDNGLHIAKKHNDLLEVLPNIFVVGK